MGASTMDGFHGKYGEDGCPIGASTIDGCYIKYGGGE
jgi:hypothetical protein